MTDNKCNSNAAKDQGTTVSMRFSSRMVRILLMDLVFITPSLVLRIFSFLVAIDEKPVILEDLLLISSQSYEQPLTLEVLSSYHLNYAVLPFPHYRCV